MAAAHWDMTRTQMSWIMSGPNENPFEFKRPVKATTMKASDIIRIYYGKMPEQ
jgi:hypothetical protein